MSIYEEAVAVLEAKTYSDPKRVYSALARLRKEAPVINVSTDEYRPVWLITKNKDIEFIEGNPALFTASPRHMVMTIETEQQVAALGIDGGLVSMDGERHRKMRQITQSWFMPRNLKALEGQVAQQAKQFVDLFESKAPECDFASDVAFWYPLRVILGLLGMPEDTDRQVVTLTQNMFGHQDEETMSGEDMTQIEAIMKFFELLMPLVEDRKQNPGDDLASVIVNSDIDGEPLSVEEILGYLLIAVTAGHDTTSASLAGGLLALIENPDELQKLRDNPDLIPLAVDEMIRWVAPVKQFARTAVEDVELSGVTIPKGDSVMMLFASGCRDEENIPDPDEFRVDRQKNKHMAFGYGPHMCLGKYLAKMELEAYLKELLPRLDSIELAGIPKYLASNQVTGLKNLPVRATFK